MDVAFCWELRTSVDAMTQPPSHHWKIREFLRAANKSSRCCYTWNEASSFINAKRTTQCMGISALPSRRQLPGVRERLGTRFVRELFFFSPICEGHDKSGVPRRLRGEGLGVAQLCVSRGEEAKDCLLLLRSCDMTEKKKCGLSPSPLPLFTRRPWSSVCRERQTSPFLFVLHTAVFRSQNSAAAIFCAHVFHRATASSSACIYFETVHTRQHYFPTTPCFLSQPSHQKQDSL